MRRHWLRVSATCEAALLFAAAIAVIALDGDSTALQDRQYAVIVLLAVAMGLRSATVRQLAVPDLTTTVLTLTVTGLAADSLLAGGAAPRSSRRMLSILAMGSGALVGTMLLRLFGMWVALIVAAFVVAGLALYLYLSAWSTKHLDCVQMHA